ncbi:DinB family protein [Streptomyces luteolus]|uniref:DinB family protein n=1 Tax=Streptomyces luteolus TaxID=3043615 RepID=A0ABT6T250_9ACTN|nr:DinB family protein [Streptomyces sp. B-S-A12]MDI3421149.1 DinB family protein [Streptomyces sp. B-S-A12]
MNDRRAQLLVGQFEVAWALCDYHLERLVPDDFLWEPAPLCWTLHRTPDGGWRPDWAETEPDPVPVPTVAWLSWHIGWWWTTALAHLRGTTPPEPLDVEWPGPGLPAVEWLGGLRTEWLAGLEAASGDGWDEPAAFPWPREAGRTIADLVAWVNVELTKNAAEIGQLRLLRAVAPGGPTSADGSATGTG